jgi:hypothetical protein
MSTPNHAHRAPTASDMTLLDYFAAQALLARCGNFFPINEKEANSVACEAYMLAMSMMKVRAALQTKDP